MNPLFSFRRGVLPGALVVLGALSGCGGDLVSEPVDLAGLADRTLTYALNDVDVFEGAAPVGSHRFTVLFSLAEGARCTQLREGVTATLNGLAMRVEAGGVNDAAGRDVCEPTRAFYDFDPNVWATEGVQDARIELRDASGNVSLVLRGGKAKRQFEFLGPGSAGRLTRGQPYTYLWQPDEEAPGNLAATLLREGGGTTANLPITQDGPRLTFTVPTNSGLADHLLTLSGSAAGQVTECTGVAACQGSVFHSEQSVVTLQ